MSENPVTAFIFHGGDALAEAKAALAYTAGVLDTVLQDEADKDACIAELTAALTALADQCQVNLDWADKVLAENHDYRRSPAGQEQYDAIAALVKKARAAIAAVGEKKWMTEEQRNEFEAVCRPVIKWLCENVHPHHTVIITPTGAELLQGEMCTPEILDYLKD